MHCSGCKNWITRRVTIYDDGSEIVNYQSPDNLGHCEVLGMDTKPDFGCVEFAAGDHVVVVHKPGEPWQHHIDVACPDCIGVPGGDRRWGYGCHRCAGTGKVRKYDDGFVGEEQTRMHPKEKELRKQGQWPPPPLPGTILAPTKEREFPDTGGVL